MAAAQTRKITLIALISSSPAPLWTPIERSLIRLKRARAESAGSMEHFNACLHAADVLSKLTVLAVLGLEQAASGEPISQRAFDLSRANATGDWLRQLDGSLSQDQRNLRIDRHPAAWLDSLREHLTQASRRPDADLLQEVAAPLLEARNALVGDDIPANRLTPRKMLGWFVEIRNKTVAHSALGSGFWRANIEPLSNALDWLIGATPLWQAHLLCAVPASTGIAGRLLVGADPSRAVDPGPLDLESCGCLVDSFIWELPPLVWVRTSDNNTFIANGSWRDSDSSVEFLCHSIEASAGSEGCQRRSLPNLGTRPSERVVQSETHGLASFTFSESALHNLPPAPDGYVARPTLERSLSAVCRDPLKRHLVNVKGFGGIGKTSLVLHLCHELAEDADCPYQQIVWISARDVDLGLRGPKSVTQAAATTADIWAQVAQLWEAEPDNAQSTFESAVSSTSSPTLLVLDNFETFSNQEEAYAYLDEVVTPPSKVIITSRHDFRGDFQIRVTGMESTEAHTLIRETARRAHREGLIDENVSGRIFDKCQGHPYAMKLVASNIQSKAAVSMVLAERLRDPSVLDALFRASVSELSEEAEFAFLLASRFSSGVSEAALYVIAQPAGVQLTTAIASLRQRSLLDHDDAGHRLVMPAMAREFARRFMAGHLHRTEVEAAELYLKRWPGLVDGRLVEAAEDMERSVLLEGPEHLGRSTAETIRLLTAYDGRVWSRLARVLKATAASADEVDEAYKRAVEQTPSASYLLLEWADSVEDVDRQVELRVQAVTANPRDFKTASEVARVLTGLRARDKVRYDQLRWRSLMRPVADVLEQQTSHLDGNDCSRLAWLYLNLHDETSAKRVVRHGSRFDNENGNLRKLRSRLAL